MHSMHLELGIYILVGIRETWLYKAKQLFVALLNSIPTYLLNFLYSSKCIATCPIMQGVGPKFILDISGLFLKRIRIIHLAFSL